MDFKVRHLHGVYIAIAFDEEGSEVARMTALSKPHALQLLEEKLGLKTKRPLKQPGKTKKTSKGQCKSVMQGLTHVTESRGWKTTK